MLLQSIISFRPWFFLTLSFLPADISGASGLQQVHGASDAKCVCGGENRGGEMLRWHRGLTENGHFRRESSRVKSNQRVMAPSLTHTTWAKRWQWRKKQERKFHVTKTIKMVSSISGFLWFCDLEVMFHMITMTFATFEKKKTFFSCLFF